MKKIALLFTCCFLLNCALQAQNNATPKPFVLGEIRELRSDILNENRVLNIYLPDGYRADDTTRYPVIYLLDGSADEDFIHVVGLVQFNNFPWINRVPPSIVVGIANVDRKRDFTFPSSVASDVQRIPTSGGSAAFIRFLENELQPFIQKNYRTNTDRMLIGQSLGGLLASEVLFKKPALFNRYIIMSPSLWWNNASLLEYQPEILKPEFKAATQVYIGVGKEGVAPGGRVMEVDANLLADKLATAQNKNLKVFFDYLPQENHATVTHQSVFNAFRWLFPPQN